ncbi:MAG: RNA polymerase sigma factor [Oscillospiraceae bacterium]|nr:RNA polymerase sigma factor [Oscillospiraceae bacterium]MCL1952422.1 RNA polymerase sigma factor [Oscillospiraceae bacterium]
MAKSLLRTDNEIAELYRRHKSTVYRVCFAFMKTPADTEDAVQDAFLQLIRKGPPFESEEHEKAWLIRTAANICKNVLRNWWRGRESLEDHENLQGSDPEIDDVLGAVMGLPDKYKTVVYLYYYEGYDSAQIAGLLEKPQSTIRNHLHEARGLLREKLGGDFQ